MEDRTPRSSHDHGSDDKTVKTRSRVFSDVDDMLDHAFRKSSPLGSTEIQRKKARVYNLNDLDDMLSYVFRRSSRSLNVASSPLASPSSSPRREMTEEKKIKPLKAKYWDNEILAINSGCEASSEEVEKPLVVEKPHWPTLDELVARAKASQEEKITKSPKAHRWDDEVIAFASGHEEAEKPVIQEARQPTLDELVARRKANLARLERILEKRPPRAPKSWIDDDDRDRLTHEEDFIERFLNHKKFKCPLDMLAKDLQDFYDSKGQYLPKKHLPFAEDVLVGLPENAICSYGHPPRLGLPAEFDYGDLSLALEDCPEDQELKPANFREGRGSTRLGRLGEHEVRSQVPNVNFNSGEIRFRDFLTHGKLVPFINQSVFLKRRLDQDLTAVLNNHFKSVPEAEVPRCLPLADALPILVAAEQSFANQIESRNRLDQEAALRGFVPVSRLDTNVIQSEIQRRQNISKRLPNLDEHKERQLDRKKKNIADYRAREKAEREKARLASKL